VKKSFLGIFILVAISCSSDQPPKSIMSEGDMINYLIDLHIAEGAVQNLRLKGDSAKVVFTVKEKQLLKEHHITDSVFVDSYNYYVNHPIKLEEIYAAVIDSVSLRQSLFQEQQ
jgi:hypothetical protein